MTKSIPDFQARRARVLNELGEHSAMILPAAPEIVVGRDTELRYVPDPDLWYLTGYDQPEAVAVLSPAADERWTGPREDVEAAGERVGADAVHPVDELEDRLPSMLRETDRIFFRLGTAPGHVENLVLDLLASGRAARQRSGRGPAELADPGLVLDEMRLIKGPAEIDAIRDAVAITVEAFRHGLGGVRAGAGEWEVEATVDAAFRRSGAAGPAFATIAASGANATILHYTDNHRVMQTGELLLLDAGAHHGGYNADLTRTVPVDGRFAGPTLDVYQAVLNAHESALDAVTPGATVSDVHQAALRQLVSAMLDLGVLDGELDALLEDEDAWKPFFPHRTSHWLGLDVHDVGPYAHHGHSRALEPGMVLTIEPGLYVAASTGAPPHLRGIGVRIEDDVLVTADGHDVLSADLPTHPGQVAALVGAAPGPA
jgi:Xaa-Pro aminopeptidase